MKFFLTLFVLPTFIAQAAKPNKSECLQIFEKEYKDKETKLLSYYESKSLCGLNTFMTKKEFKGEWLTIISKDNKKPVINVSLDDLGTKDDCLHRAPVDFVMSCPPSGNKFKIISDYRKESFQLTKVQ